MSAVNSLVSVLRGGLNERSVRAYVIPLDSKTDEQLTGDRRSFQYYPKTISDQKATNYQTKVIPGLSHPLYQWTSGGPRTISFQAIFTRDRTYSDSEKASITKNKTFTADAQPSLSLGKELKDEARSVDIPSAIAYFRSYLDPEYSLGNQQLTTPPRPYPPRKLILGLPGLRINWGVPELNQDEVYCIMTQCDVNYDGFFADGSPRFARVDFAFAEIIQIAGSIKVQDADNRRRFGTAGYNFDKARGD